MELQSFIAKALTDIFAGVDEAQTKLPVGAVIPSVADSFDSVTTGISELQAIDFEVVVRVDESKGSEAKLNVVAAFIGGGIAGQSKSDEGHTASLKFKVPVKFRCREREVENG